MYKILFVCTGNICRSPTAEGILRHRIEEAGLGDKVLVDSAGTTGFHAGEAPDRRSVQAAKARGILIDGQRSRKMEEGDFHDFHLILALDHTHLQHLRRSIPKNATAEVALFLEYTGGTREKEVPDPYYGDAQDFEYVLDLIDAGVKPLVDKLQQQLR
jgi:protein-tyrosine phosphatase